MHGNIRVSVTPFSFTYSLKRYAEMYGYLFIYCACYLLLSKKRLFRVVRTIQNAFLGVFNGAVSRFKSTALDILKTALFNYTG